MCVYILGGNIQLDYVSEAITFYPNGSEENILDVLLTNKSNDTVSVLFLLYPHSFPLLDERRKVVGRFEDITPSFFEDPSPYNALYRTPGTRIEKGTKDKAGTAFLNIYQPNPNNPSQEVSYTGYVRGGQTIKTWCVPDPQWRILQEMGWAVFECSFSDGLKSNEPRWMRWRVVPPSLIPPNRMSSARRLFRKALNNLRYRYEIFGPFDVLHRFEEGLNSYLKQCVDTAGQNKNFPEASRLVGTVNALVSSSVVKVQDWRIHAFPPRNVNVLPPLKDGDVRACGAERNQIDFGNDEVRTCYQWKAGEANISTGDQRSSGRFRINLIMEYVSLWVRLLPWISLLLSLVALSLRLFVPPSCNLIPGRAEPTVSQDPTCTTVGNSETQHKPGLPPPRHPE